MGSNFLVQTSFLIFFGPSFCPPGDNKNFKFRNHPIRNFKFLSLDFLFSPACLDFLPLSQEIF